MLWYSLEAPRWGASNEYHNICFRQKWQKYQFLLVEKSALSGAVKKTDKSFFWDCGFVVKYR